MTSRTELNRHADAEMVSTVSAVARRRPSAAPLRRRAAGVVAALSVIGFSAAIVAPTGVALADPQTSAETETPYSLAMQETQNLTVSVEGATATPMERGTFEVYIKPKPKPKPKPASASGGGGGGGGSLHYTGGGAPGEWMAAAGIAAGDQGYVDYIVSRESGWNPNATNRSSGACGLVQAYPCSKVPGNGYNPVDNLRWANGYAIGRYGSWAGAHAFWSRNHWW